MTTIGGVTARRILAFLALGLAPTAWVPNASAQKNSGPLLPAEPPAYTPRPYRAPPAAYPPASYPPQPPIPPQSGNQSGNPDAERLAQTLPLDPQTRELRDQLPPDPAATERRLGLRQPHGPATDMRGRTPTPREIVDALAPR